MGNSVSSESGSLSGLRAPLTGLRMIFLRSIEPCSQCVGPFSVYFCCSLASRPRIAGENAQEHGLSELRAHHRFDTFFSCAESQTNDP
jgi:hypothetical protein